MKNEFIIIIKGDSANRMVESRVSLKEVLRIVSDTLAVDEDDLSIEQKPVME